MDCLIVEDDAHLRTSYTRLMKRLGFQVIEAERVTEAIYALKLHDIRVILLDLFLIDGISLPVVDYVDALGIDAMIVLITGQTAFPNGEHTKLSNRIDYMRRKPVNADHLEALGLHALHEWRPGGGFVPWTDAESGGLQRHPRPSHEQETGTKP